MKVNVKILGSTSSFNAISYSTNKMESYKGELMQTNNLGHLNDREMIKPSEMKSYFQIYSSRNTLVKDKQFHAVMSCKGREYDKKELTEYANLWLDKMGYGNNPSIIVFHNDTDNNHVHIVSSRIQPNGKKVNDSWEKLNALNHIQTIIKYDMKEQVKNSTERLGSYKYSTIAQAKLLLELDGFSLEDTNEHILLHNQGRKQGQVALKLIKEQISNHLPDSKRVSQLKQIFSKYSETYQTLPKAKYDNNISVIKKLTGYESEFSKFMLSKFGVELVFHASESRDPYGYTIIDHSQKSIYKGSEIMKLSLFYKQQHEGQAFRTTFSPEEQKQIRLELLSSLQEFDSVAKGLKYYSITIHEDNKVFKGGKESDLQSILSRSEINQLLSEEIRENTLEPAQVEKQQTEGSGLAEFLSHFKIDIGNDVDDEKINGKNRRKKRIGNRKNTR